MRFKGYKYSKTIVTKAAKPEGKPAKTKKVAKAVAPKVEKKEAAKPANDVVEIAILAKSADEKLLVVLKDNEAYSVLEEENPKYDTNNFEVLYKCPVDDYTALTKEYPEFKAKKREINKLVKVLFG